MLSTVNQSVTEKGKGGQKIDHMGNKGRTSKTAMRTTNTNTMCNKDTNLNAIANPNATSGVNVAPGRMNSSLKKSNSGNDQQMSKSSPLSTSNQTTSTFGSMRGVSGCVVSHDGTVKPKDYSTKKFSSDIVDTKMKNYQIQSNYKEASVNHQEYKPRNNAALANLPFSSQRFSSQSSSQVSRENHVASSTHHSRPASRTDNTAFAVARKALEQQNSMPKMAPINFPPLRAPQSIVNVRHPFVTEARTKHNEMSGGSGGGSGVSGGSGGPTMKSKLNATATAATSLQSGIKDLEHNRQTTFYGTSQIAGIPNVQNLSNVTANMSPYPRPPDSFPQPPTVASVLFPETAQFPQSPPFSTTQIGQLNQYQTYDPGSFATTPVNVNPVIPQFSAESSIPYPQYENPQFVQPNHYPTDIASSQYQYQAAGVGQLQDSPMFIQSLQSPITVTDQYAAPNYARAVRTELIPRLRRPPRFNK